MSPETAVPLNHLRLFLHDLNNELFATSGNLQLHELLRGRPGADEALLPVRQAADEMSAIVAELSDYGTWCCGEMTPRPGAMDLGEAVQRGIALAGTSLARFGKAVNREQPVTPITVRADASYVARAVFGLIRQGAWRGPASSPVPLTTGEQDGLGVVSVADAGPAVPTDLLDRIFTVEGILECKQRGVPPGRPTAILFARVATESVGGRCWARSPGTGMLWSIGFPLSR